MRRDWWILGLMALAGLLIGLGFFFKGCEPGPSTVERRVDNTLAEVPAWRDTVRARDSVIAERDKEAQRLRNRRAWEHARAEMAEQSADSLQRVADSLAQLRTGTTADTVAQLGFALEAQKRAAVQFQVTIERLKSELVTADRQLAQADSTIGQHRQDLAERDRRLNKVTKDLEDLREETKHKGQWNVIGLHLPAWTKTVATAGLSAAATACVFTCGPDR